MMILDPRQRNGVILLVVITLLTLFAVLGIGFVMYANTTAEGARLGREAQTELRPDVEPELLLSYFLGQLIYDCPDDATGVYSALRGHSLARSMYGLNYDNLSDLANPVVVAAKNSTPYHGTGRLRNIPSGISSGPEDYYVINYTFFPRDGILRDPERPGARSGGGNPLARGRNPFIGGYNAPYTYPDLNNMYLAAMKADGTLMLPSFHRPWTDSQGRFFGSLAPSNLNWTKVGSINEHLKYLVLRPRPADHLLPGETWPPNRPHFPLPADAGGDVKNLIGYPPTVFPDGSVANNDSIWLDLDAPIMTAPDGRKYKPLFAPLILDLDNRVNLNVHGNAWARNPGGPRTHASNQGWGPWEVNPGHLGGIIDPTQQGLTPKQAEWAKIFAGNPAIGQRGRRENIGVPYQPNAPVGRAYSLVDLDGTSQPTDLPTDAARLPGTPPALPWQTIPTMPRGYENASAAELRDHPIFANPYTTTPHGYVFPLSNIEALLRYGDTGSPALTSEIFRLAPLNFGDSTDPGFFRRRNLVTMLSADIDRPGITPFFWTDTNPRSSFYHYAKVQDLRNPAPPTGPVVPFSLDARVLAGDTEYGPDWRTRLDLTQLRRLDLNRYLPKYPDPDSSTGEITDTAGVAVAVQARQYMAEEIFELLCRVTGSGEPRWVFFPPFQPYRWEAFRWLAQLAVNIVDFIDPDDCITPFRWDTLRNEWVFGTELPRLIINEVYLQYDNHRNGLYPNVVRPQSATSYLVSSWVELLNPLADDPGMANGGAAILSTASFSNYKLAICGEERRLRDPKNVRGDPGSMLAEVWDLGPPRQTVKPVNRRFFVPTSQNEGFYVVGPNFNAIPGLYRECPPPNLPTSHQTTQMRIPTNGPYGPFPHTYLLRRLACPNLTPNDDPSNPPLYNPYVTVDYVENIPANDGRAYDAEKQREFIVPLEGRRSYGRSQPYAAYSARLWQAPIPRIPWPAGMPQNSFFQHNVTLSSSTDFNWPDVTPTDYPHFDWLTHLDRPLISPMELVHVSAFKPHELTQQFITDEGPRGKYKHLAPWFDEELDQDALISHRLYRVLEFLTTGHRSAGMGIAYAPGLQPLVGITSIPAPGTHRVRLNAYAGPTASGGTWEIGPGSTLVIDQGRRDAGGRLLEEVVRLGANRQATFLKPHDAGYTVAPVTLSDRIPGKININTIWDEETFLALCDPQPANGNGFAFGDLTNEVFPGLMKLRTPNGVPAEGDRPFLGMGVGNYTQDAALFPRGAGINNTYFCTEEQGSTAQARRPILHPESSDQHHYFQNQLLHKIYNHLTTRSNVFAVWVTVGFFEVIDDTSRPVKLGAELTLADGSTRRHRMFSVVDRSVLTANPGPQRQFRLGNNPANAWTTGLVVPYYSIIQ